MNVIESLENSQVGMECLVEKEVGEDEMIGE
jgi:hypothetical protein